MKFTVERDVLADAVTWVARTLPGRPANPILAGMLLELTSEGVLSLSSFDYEVSGRVEIPADVVDPGTVLVSGKLLADICRSLPDRPVEVNLQGTKLALKCGSSKFSLLTMPTEDYPPLPTMPDTAGTIAADVFTEAATQVTIAAARDEALPILTGVRIEIEGETITMMATDRYRLALREFTWRPTNPETSAVALVRGKTLSDVAKTLGTCGEVTLALTSTGGQDLIGFQAMGRRTTSLLVDGEYPKVRSLFPQDMPTHAVVATGALMEAVRRVALVAERTTPVRLSFTDGQVILEAGQGDDAQASEALEATLTGEEISTAFNPQFLLDGLGALHTKHVRLSFTVANKPVVLTGQQESDGEDEKEYRYLLMPIRLEN